MNGVRKEASTTTKLRVVFDGSAASTMRVSLNEMLLPGSSLYPLLTTVINCLCMHQIALSADISQMFREVRLHEEDRDLHRFLLRESDSNLIEHRMTRMTFGITSLLPRHC